MSIKKELSSEAASASASTCSTIYGRDSVHKDVIRRIDDVMATLQEAEIETKELFKIARAHSVSFGLAYNYVAEDIAQAPNRLRYMRLVAERQAAQQERSDVRD
jgi:hypothetical protein